MEINDKNIVMRKTFISILAIFLLCMSCQSQNPFTGIWQGEQGKIEITAENVVKASFEVVMGDMPSFGAPQKLTLMGSMNIQGRCRLKGPNALEVYTKGKEDKDMILFTLTMDGGKAKLTKPFDSKIQEGIFQRIEQPKK
jgi:hypothetical protein